MASSSLTFAKDLLRHNLVIFRGGEGALQVLPQLLGVIPEARLNLAIHYLKQGVYTYLPATVLYKLEVNKKNLCNLLQIM